MAVSIPVLIVISLLHIVAFVLAIGAERNRSKAKVVTDGNFDYNYCLYSSSPSTLYGLVAFSLVLVSQMVVNIVTKCLCFNKGVERCSLRCSVATFFYIISWVSFLGAEVCLLGGSIKNAQQTKYRTLNFGTTTDLSCETLHKGVFAAGAIFVFLLLIASVVYYWVHSMQDAVDSEHLQDEKLPMISSDCNST
uniref:uncharacterized protein LOC122611310 n=1 Tax=Erigeron canadensis TaxID=72917 RepID=UPI001CB960EE|nr:uncharacterized protein LOC122611310 [Erigeron canadensis]